ncbi:SDR family NAD(P)-dependent oxidoreductase [Amycolatopsis australiensis]|uniref:NAD(P)-dependent dehydrogenase, short-chain alcohol dehydrogenase family n=1 Tax=Amycolatopsis australiensis TaxID=546364 RepID=A0A1K1T355_9PSEU|nr:SDR family oxidoreductase [Amycolatopsis australiensis]SFW91008.1 NAD(P)-dependent dehydrogenase, short-chain alcohol dehydrogenase family [Amycolatopsis australiensis]
MTAQLSGTTALVTGGTSGIGRATAVALAGLGAHVVLSGRDATRGAAAVESIRAEGGKADFVAADLTDASSARSLAERARELGGHIDVLVNNAGIFPAGPTAETTEADFERVYATNVKVPFFLVAELAPEMAARGHGAIVNVSTMVASRGMAGMALYGSSKAAIELMTKAWAAEFGPSGVRVNAVSPGPTRTEGTAAFGDGLDELAAAGPAGRPASPAEIAGAIAFLVTADASFVHGAILPVDGGRLAV